jgi:hypothetical protein
MLADKEGKVNSKSTFMGTSKSRNHNPSLKLKALRFNPRASAIYEEVTDKIQLV